MCAVLAAIVTLCAVMIAIPGIYRALFDQPTALTCHLAATESPLSMSQNMPIDHLAMASGSDTNHPGSMSVCGGDYLNTESPSELSSLLQLFGAVLFLFTLAQSNKAVRLPANLRFVSSGPPYSEHLRSHLGLGRLHV